MLARIKRPPSKAKEFIQNPLGIQLLNESLHRHVFKKPHKRDHELVKLSMNHLSHHDLLGKSTSSARPVEIPQMPGLLGNSLDEHFYKIASLQVAPCQKLCAALVDNELPPLPENWALKSGWMKYSGSSSAPTPVEFPDAEALVFDTEVLFKRSLFPVMATAASPDAWYAWISPWITGESDSPRHLIPLDKTSKYGSLNKPEGTKKVIVGHNVGYDRKMVKNEYALASSNLVFMDTMSLHVATSGVSSQQRIKWRQIDKIRSKATASNPLQPVKDEELEDVEGDPIEEYRTEMEENPWFSHSSINNLADVAMHHCKIKLDKNDRELFAEYSPEQVKHEFSKLLTYCAKDVVATHKVFQAVFPQFLKVCPHPVSLAGICRLSSAILPVDKSWSDFVENSEACYRKTSEDIQNHLKELAKEAVKLKDDPSRPFERDPWLSQLDWTITPVKLTKKGAPYKNQKLPGYPAWYKDLVTKDVLTITLRSRIAPLLLRLQWMNRPIMWSQVNGWVFPVNAKEDQALFEQYSRADMNEETNLSFKDDTSKVYYRVPHPSGPALKCTIPLGKGYVTKFEKNILTSDNEYAQRAIQMSAQTAYWMGARERVMNQNPVWASELPKGALPKNTGMILPRVIPMGTVTRRAVEETWLTASNAKKNRIGSELKAMVKAPPGYCFVGADVDSEELWIASLFGDSLFGEHGSTALGWMTLEGTKSQGTDLHSKTASILGISRDEAKIFNYGRIYGAGKKFAMQLLKQFNPELTDSQVEQTAGNLYKATKGVKSKITLLGGENNQKQKKDATFWRGGTESIVFNRLEELSDSDFPRSPVLKAGITKALMKKNLGAGSNYLTSRVNWTIQSSGVDYLHLIITAMDYLCETYNINARLCLTVHDEIRYLVAEHDKYRASLALQISNIWTRAIFCEQSGIQNMPLSVAFFSQVDIDHVLRKEVNLDCVTPSHPQPIPHGEALDIYQLVEKCTPNGLGNRRVILPTSDVEYKAGSLASAEKMGGTSDIEYLEAQTISDSASFTRFKKELTKKNSSALTKLSRSRRVQNAKNSNKRGSLAAVPSSVAFPVSRDNVILTNSSGLPRRIQAAN